MKTIAITIDETTGDLLEELARRRPAGHSRSSLIRTAIRELAEREREREREERDGRILRKHRSRFVREARVLIASQARP